MRTRRNNIFAIAVFAAISIISFFIYKSTLAPGVIWGDSAKLTILAYENKPIWTDIVGGHPMHTIVSSYFASKLDNYNYAYKINLFSALCGSFSVF